MTSAHAEPSDWDAVAAEAESGHPATFRGLRVVTAADWAAAELGRLFLELGLGGAVDAAAGLATGPLPGQVYSRIFRRLGCTVGDAETRAIRLTRAIEQQLAEMDAALGPDTDRVPVVPQLRQDLVDTACREIVDVMREAGLPDEWFKAAAGA